MRRWLRANLRGYDLLHTNALFSFAPAAAASAARANRVPYIVRPLGVLNQWGLRNRRRLFKTISFRLIEQRVLRGAAAIHCTSRDEAADVAKLGFGDKTVVLPLGVDLRPFQALPSAERFLASYPHLRGKQLLLFLSRINSKKGIDLLLPAFAQIAGKQTETHLVIAGDEGADASGHLAAMQQLARTLGIADKVTWTGHLDGEARLACLSAASVFVLPSYSENFGIALLEAMACGLPCIASDQVALAADEPEAVRVIPCDSAALSSALERLLSDPGLRSQCGEKARVTALQSYSMEAMGRALQNLYQRLISRPRE
jgi:glycosyltransferase involved in cell wall biosynthesis